VRSAIIALIVCLCLVPAFAAQDPFSLPVGTVVIDAGHGGHDPGASYNWPFVGHVVYERDLTLDIAKRLSVLLTLSHPELTVVMTRSSDVYLSLSERSAIAAGLDWGAKGALFVSIHINSANAPSANGFEVLTKRQDKPVVLLDEATPLSNIHLFASHSQNQLNRLLNNRNLVVASIFEETLAGQLVTSRSRGVKEQDLWVLNQCRMPAVMVELGFLTNEDEARRLTNSLHRQHLAQVLANAIGRCL
jgi:N-acetylmuramoyl-L-alanine amidase